ncbi:MAG TPA: hypothetical protein DCW68_06115 [Rhodospirillaceae bacterium]|nr:MAG: hypothetical protein A2018_03680 [Alphaproteobacteria bacterium GWF2_58_20]HAU29666.1 hypothetical protein [Rhodospirillaceae bacterium]
MEEDIQTNGQPVLPENMSEEERAEIACILARTDRPEIKREKRYPVDFRITFPMFGKKMFLAIIAGQEKRSPERRKIERQQLPLLTPGNLIVFFAMAVLFVVAVAAAGLFFAFFNGSLFVG